MRGPDQKRTYRARALRQSDNDAEAKLWSELRDRRLNGFKFVRQLPIGPYFADFACRERRLVIELDGSQHAQSKHDDVRNHFMGTEGWSVVRFWNVDALTSMPSVLDTILAICEGRLVEPVDAPDLRFRPAIGK
ncbi:MULTISPECIES: endonuclease domain-containing protein [unclassified Sinorhizobium]|uniref:endonuclease domain-containing protein n=1 Tax=unclassified Sinorhizobium TaxID=2613772 RepID=UPI003524EFE7